MHKNNTQDSGVARKGWGKSTRIRLGILGNIAFGHGHGDVIKPESI
jgi:hypothetical protein